MARSSWFVCSQRGQIPNERMKDGAGAVGTGLRAPCSPSSAPARLLLPPHQEGIRNPLSQQDPEPHFPWAALAALGGPRLEMPLHCGWNGTSSAAGAGSWMFRASGMPISLPWSTLLQLWARTWPRAHFYCWGDGRRKGQMW